MVCDMGTSLDRDTTTVVSDSPLCHWPESFALVALSPSAEGSVPHFSEWPHRAVREPERLAGRLAPSVTAVVCGLSRVARGPMFN